MAALTQTTSRVELAPIMTSQNWKRPWMGVDEHTGSSPSTSQRHWTESLPQGERQAHDIAETPRTWRSGHQMSTSTAANSPSQRQTSLKTNTEPMRPSSYQYHEQSTPNKRPRLYHPDSSSPFGAYEGASADRTPLYDHPQGAPQPSSKPPYGVTAAGKPKLVEELQKLETTSGAQANTSSATEQDQQEEKGDSSSQGRRQLCPTCNHASSKAPGIVHGLAKLHGDLATLWSGNAPSASEREANKSSSRPTYVPSGLLESLDWSLDKLNSSIDLARGILGMQRTQDQVHNQRPTLNRTPSQGSSKDKWEEASIGTRQPQRSPPVDDDGNRHSELPPMVTEEHRRRLSASSSQQSRTYPGYAPPAHSPLNIPASTSRNNAFSLPSPHSIGFSSHPSNNVLPPMSPSLHSHAPPTPSASTISAPSRSPHTSHLQDLQHQLSTKSLAHGILSSEHEKLLAAYSRSQTRCAALDRKASVSEVEIGNLVEDRIRLQTQLEMVEEEVVQLHQQQDENLKREREERNQWLRILRGAEELGRQWGKTSAAKGTTTQVASASQAQGGGEQVGAVDLEEIHEVIPPIKFEPGTTRSEMISRSSDEQNLRDQLATCQRKREEAERQNLKYKSELGGLQRLVGELAGVQARMASIGGANV